MCETRSHTLTLCGKNPTEIHRALSEVCVSRQWTVVQFHVGFIDFEVVTMIQDLKTKSINRVNFVADTLEKHCRVTCEELSEA
ncbi:hypothetical protein C0J52_11220 [Blattella germanica]|nr:hypothetical protein C0J52_11220 [Blattella germanica]